jgi:hypothetical protein
LEHTSLQGVPKVRSATQQQAERHGRLRDARTPLAGF